MMEKARTHDGAQARGEEVSLCVGALAPSCVLAAAFPVHDWQFWVVTAIFIAAMLWLGRGLIPWGKRGRARGKSTRVSLTVGGKTPDERRGR